MSVYDSYRRRVLNVEPKNGYSQLTLGQKIKSDSDAIMESTWDNDLASRVCYIYDYYHDDQFNKKDHFTYDGTTKTRIEAKFFRKTWKSLDKDQPEWYLQFKPSQKTEFDCEDELYYFETEYRQRYGTEFPIGMYVDIPDEKGVYRRWLVADIDPDNQFTKCIVLPCDYKLRWVDVDGNKRIKREMWAVNRLQSSYTIGDYRDRFFAHSDNQNKTWLPLNPVTENLWWNDDLEKTMRVIVGAPTSHPLAWRISKIENFSPIGLQKLTLYSHFFDPNRDYIEKDEDGRIIGMWADYWDYKTQPENHEKSEDITLPSSNIICKLSASTPELKIGGTYKLITAKIYDNSNKDITDSYSSIEPVWTCSIDGEDFTNKVTWLKYKDYQMKLKFPNDKKYLTQILTVRCTVTDKIVGEIQLELR